MIDVFNNKQVRNILLETEMILITFTTLWGKGNVSDLVME